MRYSYQHILPELMSLQFNMPTYLITRIARFMGPTWDSSGATMTQVGPMLATRIYGLCYLGSVPVDAFALSTLSPRQNCRIFSDDIFKCIFLNENVWIFLDIARKFVPKVPIDNTPALVQMMPWRWPGDKPLSALMMVGLLRHIYVTRPQWVKYIDLRYQLLMTSNDGNKFMLNRLLQ